MTRDGAADAAVQPSAFLDSSVLMSLFRFWDACKSASVRLDNASSWQHLKDALKSAGVATSALKLTDTINRGMHSFQILSASSDGCHYFSSRVCWSEVHHTLLEARGLEGLVRQGVPPSLRVKRPQKLYRVALQESDYDELKEQVHQFRESLHLDYGIDVTDVEDHSRGLGITPADIWDGALEIWSHVLMGVLDAYVYAAAILVQADNFLTAELLRDALKPLHNPDSDWTATVESLKQALGVAPDATLPRPITPRSALQSGLTTP